jgi:glycosyltransferase involved in cell wall biosynthesis
MTNSMCIASPVRGDRDSSSAERLGLLKIAYVITRSDHVGGAQVHVRDLAASMLRKGHEPIVLAGGSGPYTDALHAAGVKTFTVKHLVAAIRPHKDAVALAELWMILRQLRPDLISTHSSKAGVLGRLAARALRIPVVFTAHGWSFTPGIPSRQAMLYRGMERLVAPLASRIITVSEFDRELALDSHLAPPERVVTVHNGMPDISPALRADPGRSPVRLVMTARFESQKDHSTLLQALAGLDGAWQLDLIGDGPLLPQIQSLADELGLKDRVRFWGQRMDVEQLLAAAQVALLITNWEGFPRSILEAMRAGLPVVASRVGGIAESVQDGETGFLVDRGDIEGLRRRLIEILNDAGLRARMGRSGRERYECQFRLEHTMEKTMAVYQDLIADPDVRRGSERSDRIAARSKRFWNADQ